MLWTFWTNGHYILINLLSMSGNIVYQPSYQYKVTQYSISLHCCVKVTCESCRILCLISWLLALGKLKQPWQFAAGPGHSIKPYWISAVIYQELVNKNMMRSFLKLFSYFFAIKSFNTIWKVCFDSQCPIEQHFLYLHSIYWTAFTDLCHWKTGEVPN